MPAPKDKAEALSAPITGWTSYLNYGTRLQAYRAIDHYAYDRVRNFLVHRR